MLLNDFIICPKKTRLQARSIDTKLEKIVGSIFEKEFIKVFFYFFTDFFYFLSICDGDAVLFFLFCSHCQDLSNGTTHDGYHPILLHNIGQKWFLSENREGLRLYWSTLMKYFLKIFRVKFSIGSHLSNGTHIDMFVHIVWDILIDEGSKFSLLKILKSEKN